MFSVLFFLRQYQDAFGVIPLYELLIAITIILSVTFIFFCLIQLVLRNIEKSAIITSVFWGVMFFYPDIFAVFGKLNITAITALTSKRPHTTMIALLILLSFVIVGYVIGSRRTFRRSNIYFSILGGILIFVQIGELNYLDRVLEIDYRKYLLNNSDNGSTSVSKDINRDIYYIILDSYTSNTSLKEFWGYDNGSFASFLRREGFVVAENSISPYTWTGLSLASSLNMSYIDQKIMMIPTGLRSYAIFDLIRNNRVYEVLNQRGYKFINLSLFDIGNTRRYYTYPEMMSGDSSFSVAIYNKTLLGFIKQRWLVPNFSKINPSIIRSVKDIAAMQSKQPRFVYAHVMMPHWPYHFDRKGNITIGENLRGQWGDKSKYLDQLIYTNTLVEDAIKSILAKPGIKPVIIIQGDHGFRLLDGPNKNAEAHTILNAYYFPDGKNQLYQSITPANSFRILFNQYLGTDYKVLEDVDIKRFQSHHEDGTGTPLGLD